MKVNTIKTKIYRDKEAAGIHIPVTLWKKIIIVDGDCEDLKLKSRPEFTWRQDYKLEHDTNGKLNISIQLIPPGFSYYIKLGLVDRFRLRWMFGKTFWQNRTTVQWIINLVVAIVTAIVSGYLSYVVCTNP